MEIFCAVIFNPPLICSLFYSIRFLDYIQKNIQNSISLLNYRKKWETRARTCIYQNTFSAIFGSVTFVQDNNCPWNKCISPCRIRNSDAGFLPDSYFRRTVCFYFAHLLAILAVLTVYMRVSVLHAPQLPPRRGKGGERSGTLPRIYLRAISLQVQGRSLFSPLAGHARDAIRIHRRVISPRDILMLALVNGAHCETVQRDVTELHYYDKESAFLPTISGCWVFWENEKHWK